MGKGNIRTHNECEGLYYLDNDFIHIYRKVILCDCESVKGFDYDKDPSQATARELYKAGIDYCFDGKKTGWAYDEYASRLSWDDMVLLVTEAFQKRFKSFRKVDGWRYGKHIVLQNELFGLAVADNEWSVAWCLLERVDIDDTGSNRTFMRRHYQTYLEAIKLTLIDIWGEAIGYGGPWISGERYTYADVA